MSSPEFICHVTLTIITNVSYFHLLTYDTQDKVPRHHQNLVIPSPVTCHAYHHQSRVMVTITIHMSWLPSPIACHSYPPQSRVTISSTTLVSRDAGGSPLIFHASLSCRKLSAAVSASETEEWVGTRCYRHQPHTLHRQVAAPTRVVILMPLLPHPGARYLHTQTNITHLWATVYCLQADHTLFMNTIFRVFADFLGSR